MIATKSCIIIDQPICKYITLCVFEHSEKELLDFEVTKEDFQGGDSDARLKWVLGRVDPNQN